jgi:hypothetical protein
VWHVSVAMQEIIPNVSSRPIPWTDLTWRRKKRAKRIAKSLLEGVGTRVVVFLTDPPGSAVHVQKPLTDEEIGLLPDGWMDIPAIDDRGPVNVLEQE